MALIDLKQYVRDSIKTYLSVVKPDIDGKENGLGNPDVDGKILSSLVDGTRSWVENSGGGGGDAVTVGGNNFTGVQTTGIDTTTASNVIDFSTENNFVFNAISGNVTSSNLNVGQSGVIVIQSAENITGWGAEFKFKTAPESLVGDETFGYFIQSATVIRIGRMD